MNFQIRQSSFGGFMRTYRAYVDYVDPQVLFRDARRQIYNLLNSGIVLRLYIIIGLALEFTKLTDHGGEIVRPFYFCSYAERILSRHQILKSIDRCFARILISIEKFVRNDLGWNIKRITFIDLQSVQYRGGFRGVCKNSTLPAHIKNKRAV